jgi:hypothetical protein
MSAMKNLNDIYVYLFFTILAVWTLKYLVQLIFLFRQKQKITRLQAKIAMLRMTLKKNLRKKGNQVDNIVGLEQETIRKMKDIYTRTFELDFNKHTSYQELMNALKDIHDVISNTQFGLNEKITRIHKESADSSKISDPENTFTNIHFWQRLYDTDYHIVMCVYEVITSNSELLELVTSYNEKVKTSDKYDPAPEAIEITNFNLFDQVVHEKSLSEPMTVAA